MKKLHHPQKVFLKTPCPSKIARAHQCSDWKITLFILILDKKKEKKKKKKNEGVLLSVYSQEKGKI